jgi:hypothetical protein
MIKVRNGPAMCEEAKALIIGYLDRLEDYDRIHLMFISACRRNNPEAIEGYRSLLQEAKCTLQSARKRYQDHQNSHNCSETIHFEDYDA